MGGLYSIPILELVGYSLASCMLVFALIVFQYYLSGKAKGDRTLGK
jgi:hypothetical protein